MKVGLHNIFRNSRLTKLKPILLHMVMFGYYAPINVFPKGGVAGYPGGGEELDSL